MRIENVEISSVLIDEHFNCRGPLAPIDVVDIVKDIENRTIIENGEIVDPGLIEPVAVSILSEPDQKSTGMQYRLVAGFRRVRSFQCLKRNTIPAIIHPPMTEIEARILNLSENLCRKDLNILQEALAIKDLFALGMGEVKIAETLNKSRGWVQVRGMLLELPKDVQEEVSAGIIVQTQIRHLYTIMNKQGVEKLYEIAKKIKEAKVRGDKVPETNPRREVITAKLMRKKEEIFAMMDHIRTNVGNGFHTRCLAWASGEISSLDLYQSVREYAEKTGKIYTIPFGVD